MYGNEVSILAGIISIGRNRIARMSSLRAGEAGYLDYVLNSLYHKQTKEFETSPAGSPRKDERRGPTARNNPKSRKLPTDRMGAEWNGVYDPSSHMHRPGSFLEGSTP